MTPLSDQELLQRVWIERNALTTTELETKLAERFQAVLEQQERDHPVLLVVADFDATAAQVETALQLTRDFDDARPLLEVIKEFDVPTPEVLRAQLARLQQFDQAMQDLREPLQSLTTLATTE